MLSMSEKARRSARGRAAEDCAKWNASYPIGTPVSVLRDNGELTFGNTRSDAQIAQSGDAVIFVTGISGYYLLSRVEAVEESAAL